jgi:hypothetical protein
VSNQEIVWEDPPPRDYTKGGYPKGWQHWGMMLVPLLGRPGVWARIAEYDSVHTAYNVAAKLRSGKVKLFGGKKAWQFVVRGTRIYARYVGSPIWEGGADEEEIPSVG